MLPRDSGRRGAGRITAGTPKVVSGLEYGCRPGIGKLSTRLSENSPGAGWPQEARARIGVEGDPCL